VRLKAACDEFEAVLLTQIIKAAQPSGKDGVFGSSDADEIFQSQFADALASTMAKRGALGISQMVYRELGGR
jgi:Rod binding domain-containing protein